MKVVIRTYIDNERRLDILRATLMSAAYRNICSLGEIYVLDDISPGEWPDKIQEITKPLGMHYGMHYVRANGPCDTKNGWIESLRLAAPDEIILCTVDDIKFGKDSAAYLKRILDHDIPILKEKGIPWGMVGSFACYDRFTKFSTTDLFHLPTPLFYGTVCHFVEPSFGQIMIREWDEVLAGTREYPKMCDDIMSKIACLNHGYMIFNSMKDAVWHTGGGERSFPSDGAGSSYYQTAHYIGD